MKNNIIDPQRKKYSAEMESARKASPFDVSWETLYKENEWTRAVDNWKFLGIWPVMKNLKENLIKNTKVYYGGRSKNPEMDTSNERNDFILKNLDKLVLPEYLEELTDDDFRTKTTL
jgi:hypothetical protein